MLDDSAGFCKYPYGNKARDHKIPSPQAADGAGSGTHDEQTGPGQFCAPCSNTSACTPLCLWSLRRCGEGAGGSVTNTNCDGACSTLKQFRYEIAELSDAVCSLLLQQPLVVKK